jgi:hypothetical protein
MFKSKFLSLVAVGVLYIFSGCNVWAVNAPSFPVCASPQGTIKADYSSGTHGIVGSTEEYYGKDTVYQIDSKKLMQCFCPSSGGSGIQTNWWKIPDLSDSEIKILNSQGWVYIPNGALWGLEETPYMAINSNYSCALATGDNASSNLDSSTAVAAIISKAGEVLGLASTGSSALFYSLFIAGIASLLIGLLLSKKTSKSL